MTPFQKFSRVQHLRSKLIGTALFLSVAGTAIFTSCSSDTQYVNIEKTELTKGLITEVEEQQSGNFLILDERAVEKKEDSRIIAIYLDGARDTFTLDEAQLTESNDGRRRGFNSVLMGGMMGYYMGRSLSSPTSASSYKNAGTHDRVKKTTGSTLQNSAKRTTVRKPSTSKSGYGGKSTRSYGG